MYICTQFMSHLLHIDTSTDIGTVAVSGNGTLLSVVHSEAARNHAGAINLMIEDALQQANISLKEIDAILACAGPGSYTGLRIALATAKGICYAKGKPLILNNKLSLLALNETDKHMTKTIASVLIARENEYFVSIYNNNHMCLSEPIHVTEEELVELLKERENLHIISDLSEADFYKLKVSFSSLNPNITIDYNKWAVFGEDRYKCQDFVNLVNCAPFYLKQVYTHK